MCGSLLTYIYEIQPFLAILGFDCFSIRDLNARELISITIKTYKRYFSYLISQVMSLCYAFLTLHIAQLPNCQNCWKVTHSELRVFSRASESSAHCNRTLLVPEPPVCGVIGHSLQSPS